MHNKNYQHSQERAPLSEQAEKLLKNIISKAFLQDGLLVFKEDLISLMDDTFLLKILKQKRIIEQEESLKLYVINFDNLTESTLRAAEERKNELYEKEKNNTIICMDTEGKSLPSKNPIKLIKAQDGPAETDKEPPVIKAKEKEEKEVGKIEREKEDIKKILESLLITLKKEAKTISRFISVFEEDIPELINCPFLATAKNEVAPLTKKIIDLESLITLTEETYKILKKNSN